MYLTNVIVVMAASCGIGKAAVLSYHDSFTLNKSLISYLIQKAYGWLGETIGRWEGGHVLSVEIADQLVDFTVEEGERLENSRSIYYKRMRSTESSKTIAIDQPGVYSLKVKPKKLNFKEFGLKLQNVILQECQE